METEELIYELMCKILVRDRGSFDAEAKIRGTSSEHIAACMIADALRAPGGSERLKAEVTLED